MMIAVFNLGTGEINRIVECPDHMAAVQPGAGEDYIDVTGQIVDCSTHYVLSWTVIERPAMTLAAVPPTIAADGTDEVEITGAIVGHAFTISGPVRASGVVPSDGLSFTTNVGGAYTVRLTGFPYQDAEVTFGAD